MNESMKNKTFTIADGVKSVMHIKDRTISTVVDNITDPVLGLTITHIHAAKVNGSAHTSRWRLNLEETLVKDVAGTYIYTDTTGETHTFTESFYFISDDGKKQMLKSVTAEDVTADATGRLWYGETEVFRDLRTEDGYHATTRFSDINNAEWLETRHEQEKQSQENLLNLEQYLCSFVMINENGDIVRTMRPQVLASPDAFELFMVPITAVYNEDNPEETEAPLYLLAKDEAENYKYLLLQKNALEEKQTTVDGLSAEEAASLSSVLERLNEYEARAALYQQSLPTKYVDYCRVKTVVETYAVSAPVSLLFTSDSVKGFNADGRLVTLQRGKSHQLVVEWKKNGAGEYYIASVLGQNENKMLFRYRADGTLAEITNTQGESAVFTYENGQIKTIRRPYLSTLEFAYEGADLSVITSDARDTVSFTYSSPTILSCIHRTTTVSEISHGNIVTGNAASPMEIEKINIRYEYGTVIENETTKQMEKYNTGGSALYSSDVFRFLDGKVVSCVSYSYDSKDRIIQKSNSAPCSLYVHTWDEFSSVLGDTVTYTYNDFDQLTGSVTCHYPAAGQNAGIKTKTTVTYDYNADGKPICVKTTTEEYDEGTIADTRTTYEKTTYNSKGNPVRVEKYVEGKENVLGIDVSETVYDKDGKILRSYSYNTLSPSDKIYTESETDESGRTVADLDATGKHKTSYTYFADGSLASETAPNGSMLSYAYDKDGTQVSVTSSTADGEGNTNVTHYTAGLVTRVESGNHVVDYIYDGKRRLKKVKLDGADYETYTYTENADGTETVAIRYAGNHEDVVITKNATGDITNLSLGYFANADFTYTNDGRVLTAHDAYSMREFTYTYDSEKRMKSENNQWGAQKAATHDEKGRITTLNVTRTEFPAEGGEPQDKTISYGYAYDENNGRLSSVSVDDTMAVLPSYDTLGRSTGKRIQYNDALIAQEKIDYLKHGDHATALPLTVRYAEGNAWTDKLRYTYDCMGNITAVYEDEVLVCRYAYDALGRLAREDNKHFGKTKLFFYDTNGNILSRREYTFTVKSTEELTEIEPQAVVEYKYDGDRLISYDGDTRFTYNAVGFATKYRGKTLSHIYGRNLALYDRHGTPLNLFYEGSSYGGGGLTQDKDGNILSDDNFRFLYDNTGMIGFVEKSSDTKYFYRRDVQGNVIAILDNTGTVVVKYKYDAWGSCIVTNISSAASSSNLGNRNPIRYRGYYYNTSLGLYYLTTRYYDPETGRFTSADTIDYLAPDTINGLNLYAYCGNNPVMKVDPSGHFSGGMLIAFGIFLLVKYDILGVSASIGKEVVTTPATPFGGVEKGSGYSKSFDNGKPINLFVSIPSDLWNWDEYSIGIDVNVKGFGFVYAPGTDGHFGLHLGNFSIEAGIQASGYLYVKEIWKAKDGYMYRKWSLHKTAIAAIILFPWLFPVAERVLATAR